MVHATSIGCICRALPKHLLCLTKTLHLQHRETCTEIHIIPEMMCTKSIFPGVRMLLAVWYVANKVVVYTVCSAFWVCASAIGPSMQMTNPVHMSLKAQKQMSWQCACQKLMYTASYCQKGLALGFRKPRV